MQNEELDYAEVIRKGARIFLVPVVHYVNKQLQTKFGDNYLEIAKYIYANSDGSKRELRIKNDRIQWDLYNIITFICIKNSKQKINAENETIDFRGLLFSEIRDDHFAQSYLWSGQAQVLVAASYFHSLFLSALHLSSCSLMSS